MRVALVVNRFPTLSETFIYTKVAGLRRAGLEITVVVHDLRTDAAFYAGHGWEDGKPNIVQAATAGGLAALPRRLAMLGLHAPVEAARLWRRAHTLYGGSRRAARAWAMALPLAVGRHDIVHFEFSGLAIAYLDALPLLAPARLVASCRGAAEQITPVVHPARAGVLRQLFPLLDRVHCVSEEMLQVVERYGATRARSFINHPAVDAARFRRRGDNPPRTDPVTRLVSTGRLHWKKGFETALLAMRELVRRGHPVHYDIVGDGPEAEKLRYLVHDLGLTAQVTLRGAQPADAVREALEGADIFLLPSMSEGLSNAALEAMAMALPVVSTSAGGMAEAIVHGRDGLLVPPHDALALAGAAEMLVRDPALRLRLGHAARERVAREFSLERQVAIFVREYEALVGASQTPAHLPMRCPGAWRPGGSPTSQSSTVTRAGR